MAAIEAAACDAPVAGANTLTQQHALIRDADEYADLFATRYGRHRHWQGGRA